MAYDIKDEIMNKKPELPHGWIVRQSKSYPDRVYYFNTQTGASTWEVPELLRSDHKKTVKKPVNNASVKDTKASVPRKNATPAAQISTGAVRAPITEAQFSPAQDSDNDSLDLEASATRDGAATAEWHAPPAVHSITTPPVSQYPGPFQPCMFTQSHLQPFLPHTSPHSLHGNPPQPVFCQLSPQSQHLNSLPSKVHQLVSHSQPHNPQLPNIHQTSSQLDQISPVSQTLPHLQASDSRSSYVAHSSHLSHALVSQYGSESLVQSSHLLQYNKGGYPVIQQPPIVSDQTTKVLSEPNSQPSKKSGIAFTNVDKSNKSVVTNRSVVKRKVDVVKEPSVQPQKRTAEQSGVVSDQKGKKFKADVKTEPPAKKRISDTRKVVKRSPPSMFDTCNLSPRESSPDALPSEKQESIQLWINQLEPDDPPSDSLSDLQDQSSAESRVSPDSGNLSLGDMDNRRVVSVDKSLIRASDSGISSIEDADMNIMLTIRNESHIKRAVVNPWKGVHENPPPVNHSRRDEEMDIDEVQNILSKEDDRQIEDMDVSEIVLKEVRNSIKKCPNDVMGKLTQSMSAEEGITTFCEQSLCIVIDTNVLMGNLAFVEDIRDHSFDNFGLPQLVIPWVVMQELDAMKSNKSSIATMSMKTGKYARSAVSYLYECFQDRHPRIVGQNPMQAAEASKEFEAECNDDRIIQCCLQCQKNREESLIVLLTNDKNLIAKSEICKIPAFSRLQLMNGLKSFKPKKIYSRTSKTNDSSEIMNIPESQTAAIRDPVIYLEELRKNTKYNLVNSAEHDKLCTMSVEVDGQTFKGMGKNEDLAKMEAAKMALDKVFHIMLDSDLTKKSDESESMRTCFNPTQTSSAVKTDNNGCCKDKLLDEMLCKLKMWLKEALSTVLEREMKIAYEDLWLEIIVRKPPWTLSDVLQCFKKHWIAVFGFILRRNLSMVVDRLYARFTPVMHFQVTIETLKYLLEDCLELLEACNKHKRDDPPVVEALKGMKICQQLCIDLKNNLTNVKDLDEYMSTFSQKQHVDKNKNKLTTSNQVTSNSTAHIQLAEAKLTNVWDIVYSYCEDIQKKAGGELKQTVADFIPALDEIRFAYEQALRHSPKEVQEKPATVHGLCVGINSFYLRLKIQTTLPSLDVESLQALFGQESKRDMLKNGLDHLDKMICKIYEQVRMITG